MHETHTESQTVEVAETQVVKCNRRMSVADDMGDNSATIQCQLPRGHKGPHLEHYTSDDYGEVTIFFEKGDVPPVDFKRLAHIIPVGETCTSKNGVKCPFFATVSLKDDGYRNVGCYLEGGYKNNIYNHPFSKAFQCLDATSKQA